MSHLREAVWDSTFLPCMKHSPASSGRDEASSLAAGCSGSRVITQASTQSLELPGQRGEAGGWCSLGGATRPGLACSSPAPQRQRHVVLDGVTG